MWLPPPDSPPDTPLPLCALGSLLFFLALCHCVPVRYAGVLHCARDLQIMGAILCRCLVKKIIINAHRFAGNKCNIFYQQKDVHLFYFIFTKVNISFKGKLGSESCAQKRQGKGKAGVACGLSAADLFPIIDFPCLFLPCRCVKAAILVEAGFCFLTSVSL